MSTEINILIIEDEPLVAKGIINQLKKLPYSFHISGPIQTVKEGKEYFESGAKPDLILSDIQLADGISFDIFSNNTIPFPIIFLTAFDEYALKAFKLNSIAFLLKPVSEEELKWAIDKFSQNKSFYQSNIQQENFKHFLTDYSSGNLNKYKERFTASFAGQVLAVRESEILFFKKDEFIFVVLGENKTYRTDYDTLEQLEEVCNPNHFFRVNRQYLVHKESIRSYQSHHTGKLILHLSLETGEEITVSREKAAKFKTWFEE